MSDETLSDEKMGVTAGTPAEPVSETGSVIPTLDIGSQSDVPAADAVVPVRCST